MNCFYEIYLQTKLIKLFSRQVVAKKKYAGTENANELQHYPKLVLWLKVVGLSAKSIEVLVETVARRLKEVFQF